MWEGGVKNGPVLDFATKKKVGSALLKIEISETVQY